jgi:hypothetical protein
VYRRTLPDVVAAVFLFYPKDEFENDREKLHRAFSNIRKNHFDQLKELVFRKNLLFPRSRILDEILSSLQPEFLGKINPTYDTYTIKKEKLQKLWDTKLKDSLHPMESELKTVAEEMSRSLNA